MLLLSEESKKLFQWIAGEVRERKAGAINFETPKNELGISDDEKLNGLLKELRDHPDILVVKEIIYGKATVSYFIPHSEAYKSWVEYTQAESDPTILSTNTSDISVSFNPGDGSECVNIFPAGTPSDAIATSSAANIAMSPEQYQKLLQAINQAKEAEVGQPYMQNLEIGGGVNVSWNRGIGANAFFRIGRGQKKVWKFFGK